MRLHGVVIHEGDRITNVNDNVLREEAHHTHEAIANADYHVVVVRGIFRSISKFVTIIQNSVGLAGYLVVIVFLLEGVGRACRSDVNDPNHRGMHEAIIREVSRDAEGQREGKCGDTPRPGRGRPSPAPLLNRYGRTFSVTVVEDRTYSIEGIRNAPWKGK